MLLLYFNVCHNLRILIYQTAKIYQITALQRHRQKNLETRACCTKYYYYQPSRAH